MSKELVLTDEESTMLEGIISSMLKGQERELQRMNIIKKQHEGLLSIKRTFEAADNGKKPMELTSEFQDELLKLLRSQSLGHVESIFVKVK